MLNVTVTKSSSQITVEMQIDPSMCKWKIREKNETNSHLFRITEDFNSMADNWQFVTSANFFPCV